MNSPLRANLVMLAVVLIWGFNFSIVKIAFIHLDPVVFAGVRFFLATILMLAVCWALDGGLAVQRRDLLRIFLIGLAGHAIFQILFVLGMDRTDASSAGVIFATGPIFTAILSSLRGHERLPLWTWLGVVLSAAGVTLVVTRSDFEGFSAVQLTGDLLLLVTSFGWALYTVEGTPLFVRYSPLRVTAVSMALASIVLLPVSLPGILATDWANLRTVVWLAVLYSSIFAIGVAYVAWYYAVKQIGSTKTAVFQNLVPIVSIGAAGSILAESITFRLILGCSLTISGVLMASLRIQKYSQRS